MGQTDSEGSWQVEAEDGGVIPVCLNLGCPSRSPGESHSKSGKSQHLKVAPRHQYFYNSPSDSGVQPGLRAIGLALCS